jgi:hypothetical protein
VKKRHDEIDIAAGQNWSPLGLSRGLYWAIGQKSDMCISVGSIAIRWMGALPLRVASSNSWVSTCSAGSWTYRTTDPRIKQFFTAI